MSSDYSKYLYQPSQNKCPSEVFIGQNVFYRRRNDYYRERHFVRRNRMRNRKLEVLIFTDGDCSGNGRCDAEGRWRFMASPLPNIVKIDENRPIVEQCNEIEDRVDSRTVPATSVRAKMIAVLEALRSVNPIPGLFRSVVVATDLELITKGMSDWVWHWRENGWCKSSGDPVRNDDLWEDIVNKVLDLEGNRVQVRFWKVPRIKESHARDTEHHVGLAC